jgi:transposase
VFEPTGSQRDAASTIFNLSDYRAINALDVPGHARRVEVESTSPPGCPACGVISVRVHSRRRQRIRDVPVAGALEVVWCKRRWFCDEWRCGRGTFAESTLQVPTRARSTVRLRAQLVAAVIDSGRAVSETARAHGVSWWLVQTAVTTAALLLPAVGAVAVKHLGVDEHRYRSVRFYRTQTGAWARYEPGGTSRSRGRMSTIVDVTTGQVLGIVDGRGSAGVGAWLAARPAAWLAQVEVVAIDPSAAFRKALRTHLPFAAVSVDTFHLVKLGNDAMTAVRQRLVREQKGRRGRLVDPAWANRRLLPRGADTLSPGGWARLEKVFRHDDPTDELGAAWGIKEQLRRLLKTSSLADAHEAKMLLGHYIQVADMPETDRLWNTICVWWPEIEVLIVTGVTNAPTEAANTTIKNIKRTGRGFRSPDNYRARILLTSAAKRAA